MAKAAENRWLGEPQQVSLSGMANNQCSRHKYHCLAWTTISALDNLQDTVCTRVNQLNSYYSLSFNCIQLQVKNNWFQLYT